MLLHHDHGFAFQAKGHGKKYSPALLSRFGQNCPQVQLKFKTCIKGIWCAWESAEWRVNYENEDEHDLKKSNAKSRGRSKKIIRSRSGVVDLQLAPLILPGCGAIGKKWPNGLITQHPHCRLYTPDDPSTIHCILDHWHSVEITSQYTK